MGAPELPGDTGEEDLRPAQNINLAPIISSDSENENNIEQQHPNYANPNDGGYQPLAMNEEDMDDNDLMDEETDNDDDSISAEQVIEGDPNLPYVESVDAEIEHEVWSAPRPQELQIELDNARTAQIMNAMANFTLPHVAVPEWAAGVPEEHWKEELLQRIRQRKEPQRNMVTNQALEK